MRVSSSPRVAKLGNGAPLLLESTHRTRSSSSCVPWQHDQLPPLLIWAPTAHLAPTVHLHNPTHPPLD